MTITMTANRKQEPEKKKNKRNFFEKVSSKMESNKLKTKIEI